MSETTGASSPPKLKGIAGYETPYPYLDRLQEKMEERLAHRVPAAGRFCGFCYARLRNEDEACPFCATKTAKCPTVNAIPQEVLHAYKAKASTEARWVHTGAFTGLIVASAVFILMVMWGPGFLGHPALAFAELLLGGYFLAQFFGPFLFAQWGYKKGARKRDALWGEWLAKRERQASPPD